LELLFDKVDSLKMQIAVLTDQDKALRILADLPEINDETRKVGVGGPAFSYERVSYDSLDPMGVPSSRGVDIDQLIREADLLKSSYEDIEHRFTERKEVLDHTPTILPTTGWFTSFFGRRQDPFTGRYQFHYGVDIANRKGTLIYAPADGIVRHFDNDKDFGRLLVIDHGYGFVTRYGHLQKCLVQVGQEIKRGQKIAVMGSTGRSTSTHLHYEVQLNGNCQNPLSYFYADAVVD
jgi:murein DD-endopeptidase MepM/ murein hydrolase activator NlpD